MASSPKQFEMAEVHSEVSKADMQEAMQAPGQMGMEGEHEAAGNDAADVNVGDLKPCLAAICCTLSLYCKWPECIGVNTNGQCLGFFQEATCCKTAAPSKNEDGICCICCKGGAQCLKPRTCCGGDCTCCCCDSRGAFPPTDEYPALLNVACLNCVGGTGCCKTIGQLQPEKYGPK